MKVFEVVTERCEEGSTELTKTFQYVTCKDNTMLSVVDYFSKHCSEYDGELIGVREILTIAMHVDQ